MKKVLFITYYWPPAGGPGVQRIIKFVKYLPQLGWQPIILTVKDGDFPAIDDSLINSIPEECKVYKTKILEPYHLYRKFTGKKQDEKIPTFVLNVNKNDSWKNKLAKWIRINFFIPDARIGWFPYAVKTGLDIIKKENIDLILSSSPPNTVHLIAKNIARKTGLKWIADFRDPWTEAFWAADFIKNPVSKKLDLMLERSVLKKADAILTVSKGVEDLLSAKEYNTYHIVHSGIEKINTDIQTSEKFIILFLGHLSKFQNPEDLFKAIVNLPNKMISKMEIMFIGKQFDGYKTLFSKYQNINISIKDYMPYSQIMAFSKKASMLFRPMAKSTYSHGGIGAKTFDYLALRKPILAIGPKNSITAKILKDTESGALFEYSNTTGISDYLKKMYAIWNKNKYILLKDNSNLSEFYTKTNVEKLVSIFEDI